MRAGLQQAGRKTMTLLLGGAGVVAFLMPACGCPSMLASVLIAPLCMAVIGLVGVPFFRPEASSAQSSIGTARVLMRRRNSSS